VTTNGSSNFHEKPQISKQTRYLSQAIKDAFVAKLQAIPDEKKQDTYKKIMNKIELLIPKSNTMTASKLLELKQILQKVITNTNQ